MRPDKHRVAETNPAQYTAGHARTSIHSTTGQVSTQKVPKHISGQHRSGWTCRTVMMLHQPTAELLLPRRQSCVRLNISFLNCMDLESYVCFCIIAGHRAHATTDPTHPHSYALASPLVLGFCGGAVHLLKILQPIAKAVLLLYLLWQHILQGTLLSHCFQQPAANERQQTRHKWRRLSVYGCSTSSGSTSCRAPCSLTASSSLHPMQRKQKPRCFLRP